MQYLIELINPARTRVVPIAVEEPSETRARGRAEFENAEYVGELAIYVGDPEALSTQYAAFSECDMRVAH